MLTISFMLSNVVKVLIGISSDPENADKVTCIDRHTCKKNSILFYANARCKFTVLQKTEPIQSVYFIHQFQFLILRKTERNEIN